MTAQTGEHSFRLTDRGGKARAAVAGLLGLVAAGLASSSALAQPLLEKSSANGSVPVLYKRIDVHGASQPLVAGNKSPWLLQSDIRTAPFVMKAGRPSAPFSLLAAGATTGTGNDEAKPTPAAPSGQSTMPPSMTSPLLPNVPSSLNQDELDIPAQTGEPKIGAPILDVTPATGDGMLAETSDARQETENQEAAPLSAADKNASDLEEAASAGPALRKSFSALFTQQRPFLLYSQDASITYLMPNALVDHTRLSRYLRNILEERALEQWQTQRQQQSAAGDPAREQEDDSLNSKVPLEERPALVITGRVEDRFYSADFSSLYLEEVKSLDGQKQIGQILSFNYDNVNNAPFGLQDLFQAKDDKELASTIELIDAYIQTDIVRQKSIRLGTLVRPDQDSWLKDLKPSLSLLQNFTLVPSRETSKIAGLSFHFNPGILGAEADGQYDVYVPASIFSATLSERFAPHFGGEALRVSRHNAKGFSAASVNVEGLRSGAELGGDMLIEGEVPGNWCDGFHLTLTSKSNQQIVTEGVVKLLPDLPSYGLASNMMRFRAELSVAGDGEKSGTLLFEPYAVTVQDDHVVLREDSACNPAKPIAMPDPSRDQIAIDVNY
ncbi:hypothetical protein [Cohaesibacter marisflavi]|uniref:hypothetical protein n=1 Tax=Cohaesibacter marisflavi TaxID=655353 RepID=UPI0029C7D556|nr:hypothetical protein [Cohaesibacter marisflavi]